MSSVLLMSANDSGQVSPTATATQYKYLETPADKKPRVVITADPELDDNNSMIRYILMSDGYQTEGLIYVSSQFHWSGDGTGKTLNVPSCEYNRNGMNFCPCPRRGVGILRSASSTTSSTSTSYARAVVTVK